mmetsp:Transcript_12219/g.52517  ORF Transcript_12219/g.52517 Transcript_12219/m.52517 type:complete len:202 (+) Transcript_12219:1841-2446(+)
MRLPSPFPLDRSSFSSPEVAPVDVLPARGRVRLPGPKSDVPRVPALRHRALHVARPKNHSRGVAPSGLLLHGGPPGRAPLVVPVVVRLLLAAHEGHRAEGLVARQRGARRGARRRRPDGGRKRADGRVGERRRGQRRAPRSGPPGGLEEQRAEEAVRVGLRRRGGGERPRPRNRHGLAPRVRGAALGVVPLLKPGGLHVAR